MWPVSIEARVPGIPVLRPEVSIYNVFWKNCQETKLIHMWLLKPEKSSIKWLLKPAVLDQYKRLCCDKNCQTTRCYRKKCPVRPMCGDDKNCQSPKKLIWNLNLKELTFLIINGQYLRLIVNRLEHSLK